LRTFAAHSESPLEARMNRSIPVVVVLASLAACSKPAPAPTPARAVRVVEVRASPVGRERRYAGTLEPRERVDLAFRVPGRVRSVGEARDAKGTRALHEGDAVKRGQVLATLDERDLTLQAAAAQASATAADADVEAARATLAQAQADTERARALAASRSISGVELERAESALAAASARFDAARGQRRARGDQAAIARRTTEDLRLVSPIDGVIARRNVDVGENANPGAIAFSVIDTSEMRLAFAAPDTLLRDVRVGDHIPVRVASLADPGLVGVVAKIDPVADPVTRTYRVDLSLPNARGELRAGMVATAVTAAVARASVARVPLASVVRSTTGTGFAVWKVDVGGRAVAAAVEVGDVVGDDVEVERGVAPGDRVVSDGAGLLREGEAVEVTP
jgi:RND family efflux transporter MFP subunit